jgi:hypothetical protein
MAPDDRDRSAGGWVVVSIVRVGPTRVVSR